VAKHPRGTGVVGYLLPVWKIDKSYDLPLFLYAKRYLHDLQVGCPIFHVPPVQPENQKCPENSTKIVFAFIDECRPTLVQSTTQ
jgi:hypothetical protein